MALIAYMQVNGSTQGMLKGDCVQAGDKKDTIIVYGSDHFVEVPRDVHTGLPTGAAIHHTFTVTKHKDQSTPMKLELGGTAFEAWGVHNELSVAESYFVRLTAAPEALVFGSFPDADDPSVFTVYLS